jgi:hypothetical protein
VVIRGSRTWQLWVTGLRLTPTNLKFNIGHVDEDCQMKERIRAKVSSGTTDCVEQHPRGHKPQRPGFSGAKIEFIEMTDIRAVSIIATKTTTVILTLLCRFAKQNCKNYLCIGPQLTLL